MIAGCDKFRWLSQVNSQASQTLGTKPTNILDIHTSLKHK